MQLFLWQHKEVGICGRREGDLKRYGRISEEKKQQCTKDLGRLGNQNGIFLPIIPREVLVKKAP